VTTRREKKQELLVAQLAPLFSVLDNKKKKKRAWIIKNFLSLKSAIILSKIHVKVISLGQ
jgi:hypothetical protein